MLLLYNRFLATFVGFYRIISVHLPPRADPTFKMHVKGLARACCSQPHTTFALSYLLNISQERQEPI